MGSALRTGATLVEPFRGAQRPKGMRRSVALIVGLTGVLAGCSLGGGSEASTVRHEPVTVVSMAPGWARHVHAWEHDLRVAARRDPRLSYPTPSLATLRQRIVTACSKYGFRLVLVRVLRAPQGAPLVIVQTDSSPASFVPKVSAIIRLLDPTHPATQDWESTAYEGFFLGAQDGNGRPFLAGFNVERLHEGGQWARSPSLYPFAHG